MFLKFWVMVEDYAILGAAAAMAAARWWARWCGGRDKGLRIGLCNLFSPKVLTVELLWIYFVLVGTGTYKRKSSIKILALTYLPRTAGILLYLILIFDWIFWRVNEICRNITCGYMNFCSKFLFFVGMFCLWRVKRIFLNTILFTYIRKKFHVD